MKRKSLFAAVAAASLLGLGTALSADTYDITGNNKFPGAPETVTADDNIYQSGAAKGTGNDGADVSVGGGATLTVGQTSTNTGQGFSLTLGDVTLANTAVLDITSAASSNTTYGYDVTLGAGTLDVSAGATVNLAPDTQGKVTLNVDSLNTGTATSTFNIAAKATMNVADTGTVTLNNVALKLSGGAASFAGAAELTLGTITADQSSAIAVGGGLTVTSTTNNGATLEAANGATLTVLRDLADATTLGDVTIGGTAATASGVINIANGGTIKVGDLTLDTNAALTGTGTGNILQAKNLSVTADFHDSAAVATKITGRAVVDSGMTYYVAGENNTYGSMTLNGTLESETAVTMITLGATGAPGAITIAGGAIKAGTGNTFTIDNAAIIVTDAATGAGAITINASTGALNLSTSSLFVNTTSSNIVRIDATEGITLKSLTHLTGMVSATTSAPTGKMTVLEKAVIGKAGATSSDPLVTYATDSYATVFQGGVKLIENGVIAATAATAEIGIGGGTMSGILEMAGGAKLDADTYTLTITNASNPGTASYINVTGLNNRAAGDINASTMDLVVNSSLDATRAALIVSDQTDAFTVKSATIASGELSLGDATGGTLRTGGAVLVKSGGMLSANSMDSTLEGLNSGKLTVAGGGILSATTANITIDEFDSVTINGTLTAGYAAGNTNLNASNVTGLIISSSTSTGITIGSSGVIAFTNEAALKVQVDDIIIDATGNTITYQAPAVTTSVFGSFTFGLENGNQQLVLKSTTNRIDGTGSAYDRGTAWNNLKAMWGSHQIGSDLANVVYDASVVPPNLQVQPTGSPAGEKNLAIFQAIGNPAGKNVSLNTVEYVNGAYLYGVTDVAMETNRAFQSDVSQRAKAVNGQFVAARESMGSVDALASTAMNEDYANRFWGGGFGLWQEADLRQGFSGYRYDSWGAIMGYDRVVAGGLAVGLSAAYNKGDYADKGALAHDSKIESYTGGLYAIYSHESGFTSTLFGAYTYSKNDINELRNDPFAGVNSWSKSKFHTDTWSAGGNVGWDFRPSACFTITPTVGLNYIRARNSDHASFMGGVATQSTYNARNHGLFLPAELTMQYDVKMGDVAKVRFEAGGGYAYNFNDDGMDGSMSYFDLVNPGGQPVGTAIRTRDNSQHNYKVGGGMRYNYKQFDVGVRYDYIGKTDYKAHRVVGTIGISF